MQARVIAVLIAGTILLGACSSGSGSSSPSSTVDPQYKALVEGKNPPTTLASSAGSSTTLDPQQAADLSHIDVQCLGSELNKEERKKEGKYNSSDLLLWARGAKNDLVAKEAEKIIKSGMCKK